MKGAVKIFLGRWLTAVLVGAVVAVFSWFWRYGWLPPELWEDVAVAAGLRPPEAPFPLVWHMLVGRLFQWFGPVRTVQLLLVGGHCALGMASALAFLILGETMPSVMYTAAWRASWSRWVTRLVMFQGVILFACADPVWEAGQVFGPTIFHLIVILMAVYIFLRRCVRSVQIKAMYWTMLLVGMLAAETPLGIALAIGCLVACYVKSSSNPDTILNPLGDPFVRVVVMRRMTAVAMAGCLVVVTANMLYFMHLDGLKAHDWTGFEFILHYLYHHVRLLLDAATPAGWMLLAVVVGLPLGLSLAYIHPATDDDRFLLYWHAVLYAVMGLIAFLQVAGWRSFWFWTWTGDSTFAVGSELLRCVCTSLSAQTVTYALCVLAVEIYFRNYFRIAGVRYQVSVEETKLGAGMVASFRRISRIGRRAVLYEPIILLAVLLPWRVQTTTREVIWLMQACAWQTATECEGVRYLFTDGALDAAVEICALAQGRQLYTVSMMSGNSPRERYIRTRAAQDQEDREMLNFSAVDTLRTWMRLKQKRLKDFAFQLGFELLGRNSTSPLCAGLVSRLVGFPDGLAEGGTQAVHVLLDRLLKLYEKDEKLESVAPALRDRLSYLQWRLARLCRARADTFEAQHKMKESLAESQLSDALDARNVVFKKMRQQMEIVGQGSIRLTPREGLKLGMERADFRMAELFAHQVLASDPYDVSANFALGMNYFSMEKYGRAEIYFKKCLERRPNDPAILNNLSVSQLRQKKLDEAEANALRSLEVFPNAREAKRTLENIRKMKKEIEEQNRIRALTGR